MPWTPARTLLLAAGLPLLVCLGLVPFRASLANTNIALILVLIIVAIAASGSRAGGALAAVSAAAWFDFFLTRPYEQFTIFARTDIQTTLLLLLVGVAVTEIAHWGRRQQARAGRQAGYVEGLRQAANAVATGQADRTALIEQGCQQLVQILGAAGCRYERSAESGRPRLRADGALIWGELGWDVDHIGLPVQDETEISLLAGGRYAGRFLISARPGTRPAAEQRTLAVALANLIGVALGPANDPADRSVDARASRESGRGRQPEPPVLPHQQ